MLSLRIFLFVITLIISQAGYGKAATVLVMGDSLSAGYGIKVEQGWVNLLQQNIVKKTSVNIVNASVSGETSSGGLTRLPALLNTHHPDIVIIELGANDGLRGQPLKLLRENLQAMIDASKAINAKILLIGIQIPTNYGPRYTKEFKEIYPVIAAKNNIVLVPFLLDGVAAHADLIQGDGLHPTAEAQPIIMNNVMPILLPMLK